MIRLFDKSATVFTPQGIGALSEAESCIVKEELNGEFSLTLRYPVTGKYYNDLVRDNIIVAPTKPHSPKENDQAFRIFSVTKPLESYIEVVANHISYDQSKIPLKSFDNRSGAQNQASNMVASNNKLNETLQSFIDGIVNVLKTFTDDDLELSKAEIDGQSTKVAKLISGQKFTVTGSRTGLVFKYVDKSTNLFTSSGTKYRRLTPVSNETYQITGTWRKLLVGAEDIGTDISKEIGFSDCYTAQSNRNIYATIPIEGDPDVQNIDGTLFWNKNYDPSATEPVEEDWVEILPMEGYIVETYGLLEPDDQSVNPDLYTVPSTTGGANPKPIEGGNLYILRDGTDSLSVRYLYKVLTFDKVIDLLRKNQILQNSVQLNAHPFVFQADSDLINDPETLEESREIKQLTPISLRSAISNILSAYENCDVEFDNYRVIFHKKRGSDKGVTLRYGKNITSFDLKDETEATYTHIYPYWYSSATGTMLQLTTSEVATAPFVKIDPNYDGTEMNVYLYDLTSEYPSRPARSKMKTTTEEFIKSHKFGEENISTTVSFADLSRFENNEELAESLYHVDIGDTVTIVIPNKNIDYKARCVSAEYDVLKGSYTEVEIGNKETDLSNTVASQSTAIKKTIKYASETAISNAEIAAGITAGATGSYVIINTKDPDTQASFNKEGLPQEIIVANAPNIKSVNTGMWKWNKEGLGYFPEGYYGRRATVALTKDGFIDASAIRTGVFTVAKPNNPNQVLMSINANTDAESFYLDVRVSDEENAKTLLYVNSSAAGTDADPRLIINADAIVANKIIVPSSDSSTAYPIVSLLPSEGKTYPKTIIDIRSSGSTSEQLLYVNSGYTGDSQQSPAIPGLDPYVIINATSITTGTLNIRNGDAPTSNGPYINMWAGGSSDDKFFNIDTSNNLIEIKADAITTGTLSSSIIMSDMMTNIDIYKDASNQKHFSWIDHWSTLQTERALGFIVTNSVDGIDEKLRTNGKLLTDGTKSSVKSILDTNGVAMCVINSKIGTQTASRIDYAKLNMDYNADTSETGTAGVFIDLAYHKNGATGIRPIDNSIHLGPGGVRILGKGISDDTPVITIAGSDNYSGSLGGIRIYNNGSTIIDGCEIVSATDATWSEIFNDDTVIPTAKLIESAINSHTTGVSAITFTNKALSATTNGTTATLFTFGTDFTVTNGVISVVGGGTVDNSLKIQDISGTNVLEFDGSSGENVYVSTGLKFLDQSSSGDSEYVLGIDDSYVATKTWVSNNYLPLTGGVVSGSITTNGIQTTDLVVTGTAQIQNGLSVNGEISGSLNKKLIINNPGVSGNVITIFDNTNDLKIVNGTNIDLNYSGTSGTNTLTIDINTNTVATQTWVNSQGFLKSADLSSYATQSWVSSNYLPLTAGSGKQLTGDLYMGYVNDSTSYMSRRIRFNGDFYTSSYTGYIQSQYRTSSSDSTPRGYLNIYAPISKNQSTTGNQYESMIRLITYYWNESTGAPASRHVDVIADSVYPNSSGTIALGRSGNRWSNIYTNCVTTYSGTAGANNLSYGLNIGETGHIGVADSTNILGIASNGSIRFVAGNKGGSTNGLILNCSATTTGTTTNLSPQVNRGLDLGTSSYRWKAIYGYSISLSETEDSIHSKNTTASIYTAGGASVSGNLSTKSIRIDNGQTSKGCSLQYNETEQCLNFVFAS